jgi:chromosomal replication initiation ATPase DnaA
MKAEHYIGLPNFVQRSVILRVPVGQAKELTDIYTFIRFICEKKSIRHNDLLGRSRERHLVEARQWVCYFYTHYQTSNKKDLLTLTAIGNTINRDHATVLHSIKAAQSLIDYDTAKRLEFFDLYEKMLIQYNHDSNS